MKLPRKRDNGPASQCSDFVFEFFFSFFFFFSFYQLHTARQSGQDHAVTQAILMKFEGRTIVHCIVPGLPLSKKSVRLMKNMVQIYPF